MMRSWNSSFIMVWKVAGLFVNPKYITNGSKRLRFVRNAAFHSSPSLIRTLLYPHRTSSLVKSGAPGKRFMRSSISGSVRGLTHRTLRVHPPGYPPCYPPFTLRVLYLYLTIVLLSFHVHKWFHHPCSPSVFTLRVT